MESEEPEQLVGTPYYTRAPAPVTGLTRVAAEHLVVFAQLMSFPFGIDLPFCVTEDRLREPLAPTFRATYRDPACFPSRFSHREVYAIDVFLKKCLLSIHFCVTAGVRCAEWILLPKRLYLLSSTYCELVRFGPRKQGRAAVPQHHVSHSLMLGNVSDIECINFRVLAKSRLQHLRDYLSKMRMRCYYGSLLRSIFHVAISCVSQIDI